MDKEQILELIRLDLDQGHTNAQIVEGLRSRLHIDVSVRTLQRWIKSNGLERSACDSALERSQNWIDDVRSLVNNNLS